MSSDQYLWVEKYRPKTIQDCILPSQTKEVFKNFVAQGKFPNLLLSGGGGVGKTSVAKALCEELDLETMFINASSERNIDTIRNAVSEFAGTMSFDGKDKAVILDEADGITNIAQGALRGVIEEFPHTRFILTCNYKNKIISPIQSRLSLVEFSTTKEESSKLRIELFKRVQEILNGEKVEFQPKVLAELIGKHYPDIRKILNDLQKYGVGGSIDLGILAGGSDVLELMKLVKDKKYAETRQWVATNSDIDPATLFTDLERELDIAVKDESKPVMIHYLGDYQAKSAVVANQEINTMAFLAKMMTEVEFK